jgi:hypothetical protein
MLYYLGNGDNKKFFMFSTDAVFSLNTFDAQMVEFMHAEPVSTEGWLHKNVNVPFFNLFIYFVV